MVVDVKARLREAFSGEGSKSVELPILIYWAVCAVLGIAFLNDWLASWNVGETLARPWLVVYLIITLIISQVIYFVVACDGGRSIHWNSTIIFTIGNGIFEVFAFALVYRLGEIVGSAVVGTFAPGVARSAGFILGVIFFILYGGLIHGMFWIKLLPPHFKSTPIVLTLRKYRPLAEVFLVTGWSLCFWLGQDIWTVMIIHIVLDLCMMLRVRPVLFGSPTPSKT